MATLAKPKSTDLVAMYKSCMPSINNKPNEVEMKQHKLVITEFMKEVKSIKNNLNEFKHSLRTIQPIKE